MTTLTTQPLANDFWLEVIGRLTEENQVDQSRSWQAAQAYRAKLAEHEADEWVYHRNPEDVAADIKAGGFLN